MRGIKQRSFLQNNSIVSWVFLIIGGTFLPAGIIFTLIFRPGMMVTVNDVNRPATEADVLFFRLLFGGIFGGVGLIFLIVGIFLFLRRRKRRREMERLKREGSLVVADVISCEPTNIRIGGNISDNDHHNRGRPLYHLRCSYQGIGNETYIFKSDLLREDPTPYLDEGKVNVYCDREHMTPYFVDVDESIGLGSRVFEV